MYIDCHVHPRDEKEEYKGETIDNVLSVAEDSGVDGFFDIGNIKGNPVTTRKRYLERKELALAADSPVYFGVYLLLTNDEEQVREAVETWKEYGPHEAFSPSRRGNFPKVFVAGIKEFAGKSVGDCAIIEPAELLEADCRLAKYGFNGVKSVHCEDESEMRPELWDPNMPWTHGDARPEIAEINSIKRQILNIQAVGGKYHLEIKHTSTSESVYLINEYKRMGGRISCEVTPHHLLLDNSVMFRNDGILYKVNPPLRNLETREQLFNCFLRGEIDTLATDHAPHTDKEKREGYLSGLPGIASWPDFIDILKGRGTSKKLLNRVTYKNPNNIFGTKIPKLGLPIKKGEHLGDYVFDPYESLK